jgi:uncharacterized protein (TIGR01777 family)
MKVVVAGGSGLIGRNLVRSLATAGHHVTVLSRNSRAYIEGATRLERWDGTTHGPWEKLIDGSDAVINLAGESIGAKRWSTTRKDRIRDSRIGPTRAIVDAISVAGSRPSVLVNASGAGYYGDVMQGEVAEAHPPGNDFLARLCVEWEHEAGAAEALGTRVVLARSGVVLHRGALALKRLSLPFKLFVGGPLGSGKQYFPWVHLDDEIGAIMFALGNDRIAGPMNVAGPQPVTMKEFCTELGKVLHRPSWTPVPAALLRLVLGEMSNMVLTGQGIVPRKLLDAGFVFRYPDAGDALAAVFGYNR